MRRAVSLLVVVLARVALAQTPGATPNPTPAPFEATSRHPFDDVECWKKVFDDPARDEWQRPAEVVTALRLAPGMRIADLGAGTGYFMRYLSGAVGESGTVYAVDIEPNLVTHLRERAEEEHLDNVVPVLASSGAARLPHAAVDLILIADTYHHIDDRLHYFRRLAVTLSRRGRVAIIDWHKRPLPVGPGPEHKIDRAQVVEEMSAAGYRLVDEPTILPYQYFLVFVPVSPKF